jgi:disulfide bond formation protein DsbB
MDQRLFQGEALMSSSTAPQQELTRDAPAPRIVAPSAIWLPLLVALLAAAGSLWLSVGMGLKACPLCFYQRTFVMGVVAVLGIGLLTGPGHRQVLNLLALPLALAGLGVAAFHVFLELTGQLECPGGILGLGTAPQQSLAVLALLFLLVLVGVARSGLIGAGRGLAILAALVMGLLLAWACVVSVPPMPPAPTKAYDTPLEICRPPYRP